MRSARVTLKLGVLSLITALALDSGAQAASVDDYNAGLRSAESCLSEVGELRGSIAFRQFNLAGFMRKLANDISYARSWAPFDDERALTHLRGGVCAERVAAWVDANASIMAQTRLPVAKAAAGNDGDDLYRSSQITDLEYYLRSRQDAIAAIARIQANPRGGAFSSSNAAYRRSPGY